jgi:NitT/TauT family transport system substrate-binding protein
MRPLHTEAFFTLREKHMNNSQNINLFRVFLIMILFSWGCQPSGERTPPGPPLQLTLAVSPATYSGLITIADEKGYFKKAGLEVTLNSHPSGKAALETVCSGTAQVATVTDIAFAAEAIDDQSIRVLASIGTTVGSQIVARKDRNIQKPSDLKGKTVGFSANTVSEYFLYVFLLSEDLSQKDVKTVPIQPSQQVEALVNGDVDAISAFEIYAFEAKKHLKDKVVSWESQDKLACHWLLAAQEKILTESPEPAKRLIRALLKAESFARANEEEAKGIISRKWGFDKQFVNESWPRSRLNVSFGQSIITALSNYIRWQMKNANRPEEPANALNFLHTGIMEEVAPILVTIYR